MGAIGFAAITTWVAMIVARNEYIGVAKLEVSCIAIAWIAALMIGVWLLY
jgi:hypothetical protein